MIYVHTKHFGIIYSATKWQCDYCHVVNLGGSRCQNCGQPR